MKPPVPLNPLRAFAVASRHPTFTSAAQELGVTQVAVSRQIALLEGYLGVQLFERSRRAARLTEVGRGFAQDITAPFDEIESATQRLLTQERDRTIHLRVYPSVAHYWLMPRLGDFTARHPELRVRFDTTVAPLDFRGTHLDLAIQLGDGSWRGARGRKLFDERIDVVGAPGYLDAIGGVTAPGDVTRAELLHARYRRRAWRQWGEVAGVDLAEAGGLEFDSSLLTYSAAAQGLGLAMGQVDLLDGELAAGRLMAPLAAPVATGLAFHVVWSTAVSVGTKTRHFVDWLLAQTGQAPEFFPKTPRGLRGDRLPGA